MEITPHVHSIPAPASIFTGSSAPNVYLVLDGEEGALIDSGLGDEASLGARLAYLEALPALRLRYIILTHHHFDHTSGADRLRRATAARVVMHRGEERFLQGWRSEIPQDVEVEQEQGLRQEAAKASPDALVEDGERLAVGDLTLEVIHTPGHTLGSICLYLPEERALFSGDTVLGEGPTVVSPPPYGDMALYMQSLERLKGYEVSLLLPGHGPPLPEPGPVIQELIEHRLQREEEVLRRLGEGANTVPALLASIYAEVDPRIVHLAQWQLEAHLDKLLKEGRVRQGAAGGYALV
ncbi:MAG: MBL fold metallo-hydrolase [Dehalococcoidia bacterium]